MICVIDKCREFAQHLMHGGSSPLKTRGDEPSSAQVYTVNSSNLADVALES